jgi:hypothetical protein
MDRKNRSTFRRHGRASRPPPLPADRRARLIAAASAAGAGGAKGCDRDRRDFADAGWPGGLPAAPDAAGAVAMTTLDAASRDKLVGCLRLAARPGTSGERDAAYAAALRILRARGLDWAGVIAPARDFSTEAEAEAEIETCIRALDHLTEWERRFVISLRGFRHLSPRQAAVVRDIAHKARAAAAA